MIQWEQLSDFQNKGKQRYKKKTQEMNMHLMLTHFTYSKTLVLGTFIKCQWSGKNPGPREAKLQI